MKFYKDQFDSDIFGKDVYKLILEEPQIAEKEILNALQKASKAVIFCFTPFAHQPINFLIKNGFSLISIRNTYKLHKLEEYKNITSHPDYSIITFSESNKDISEHELNDLANNVKSTSRYSKDPLISNSLSMKVYTEWIKNSLFNNYANECFLAIHNQTVIGFVSLKIKDKEGYIDLVGINKEHRNKKIASALLKHAINFLITKKIENIFVITEGENIPANILYQKNNFVIQYTDLVFHKHNK